MKLLEHFKAMQAMAGRYLEPDVLYHGTDGKTHPDKPDEDKAFINDMLYMLDGPEQREAEASVAADLEAEAADWRADLRKQIEQAGAIADAALKRTNELTDENNDLRSRLMTSELAYARLFGYVSRIEDERPPVMVPQQRERFLAELPDGTRGTEYAGWRGGAERERHWFHK